MPGYPSAAIALAFNFADDDDEAVETTNNARKTKHRHIGSVKESDADEDGDLSSPGTGSVNPAPPLSLAAARPNGYVAPSSVTANPYAATSFTDIFPALDPIHPGFYSADLDGLGPRTNGVEDQDVDGYDEGEETRTRGDGQAFVKQRKITAQLDTTDRMIVNLKTKNYPNERVAEELRKLGLTNYDPKTVGSRFIRLENAIAEHEAQRLEDELTDWHEEDDKALIRADELAQAEIKDIIQRTKNRRWQITSRNLQKLLKKELKYGPKACEKRFVDLMHDTASIPIEIDDNPDERRAERAQRVIARLNERMMIEARDRAANEQKRLKTQQESLRRVMKRTTKADENAKKAAEKALAAQKRFEAQRLKSLAADQKRAKDELQFQLTSKRFAEKHGLVFPAPGTPTPATIFSLALTSKSSTTKRKRGVADPDIADSPRVHLSVKELGHELAMRGLNKGGTKKEQIKRLEASDRSMATQDMRDKLIGKGLNSEGERSQLIDRIVASEVAESAWGQKHGVIQYAEQSSDAETDTVEEAAPKRRKDDTSTNRDAANVARAATVDSGVGGSATEA